MANDYENHINFSYLWLEYEKNNGKKFLKIL